MLAAKHMDIVMGVDIHIIAIPTPAGPVPTPLPHPFVGVLFDPDDYDMMAMAMSAAQSVGVDLTPALDIAGAAGAAMDSVKSLLPSEQVSGLIESARNAGKEFLGVHPPETNAATVYVNGLPRVHAGTKGYSMPPHIPMGGPFFKGKAGNVCEAFMGSLTVSADKRPFSFLGCMMLSCHCTGMKSLHNSSAELFLPTSTVLSIPMGMPVMVGGPPVPDLNALLNKLFDKLFDMALDALRNSRLMKAISQRIHNAAGRMMNALGIPADSFIRDMVHDEICETTGHPVVIATGKVYTSSIDFRLPGPIPLHWHRKWKSTSKYSGMYGNGWHCDYDLALGWDKKDDVVVVRMADGRPVIFPPIAEGEQYTNPYENLTLLRKKDHFLLRDKNLFYRFNFIQTVVKKDEEVLPLVAIQDSRGSQVRFQYNQHQHLEKIIDSAGRELAITCDSKGRITTIKAPHPEHQGETFTLVAYQYDVEGNLVEHKNALGLPFGYAYAKKLLVKETNRNGLSFYFEYDQNERCIHTWGDGGIYDHKLVYQLDEKWTSVTDSLDNTTKYFWNDKGLNWKIVDPLGHIQYKRYTPISKVQATIDELGLITSYEYDDAGNKTKTIYPDGTSREMEYLDGLLVNAIDQNGGKWAWEYNENRQLVKRTDCIGRITQYQFEDGLLHTVHDPAGGKTIVGFDESTNLAKLVSPDGTFTTWQYDRLGRPVIATDPKGNVQRKKYNYFGQVLKVWERDGNIREFEYDGQGNVTQVKDKHYDVKFEYAQINWLKARTEAGTRVEFKYDTEGNLLGIINEHGYAYRYELDKKFRVITESGFDGVTRRYQRDAAGRVVEVIRPNGITTQYMHDLMGRVLTVNYAQGTFEKFAYRADGELIEASNNHLKVQFELDGLGRILKEMQGGFEIQSIYDLSGLRTEVKSTMGAHFQFERNIMGDVEQVIANANGSVWEAQFKRDEFGLELERLLPGDVRATWERDQMGRPIEHRTETAGGQIDRSRKYTWDVNSRLKKINDNKLGTTRFEHDVFGNLAAATYGDGSTELRMPDSVGNLFRTKEQKDRKYGPAGQLLEANGTQYEYDPEGNLIRKIKPDGSRWEYQWNAVGMLKRVIRPDGYPVVFTYDALGRRIAKQFRNKLTRWVWDGNTMLHEWIEPTTEVPSPSFVPNAVAEPTTPSIRILKKEAPGNASNVSIARSNPDLALVESPEIEIKQDANPSLLYNNFTTWVFEPDSFSPLAKLEKEQQFSIISDHRDAPIRIYNINGERTWDMELSIYGKARSIDGWRESCPLRYPGQYEDREIDLYYNNFRYFDAENSTYISQDPLNISAGLKFYAYVNDPNYWIDPLGLVWRRTSQGSYQSYHTAQLDSSEYLLSDSYHFRESNRQLHERFESDSRFRRQMEARYPGITEHVAPGPRGGCSAEAPPGTTWHHDPDNPGQLHLVNRDDHNARHGVYHPDGVGGRYTWGGGSSHR